jgi:gliding motility-associated-like protein
MKNIYLALVLFLFCICHARATHIVGGEFELRYKGTRGVDYTLTLNLYFDEINGDPGAEDPIVQAAIFSKRTNQRIDVYTLPKVSQQQVYYTNPVCTDARLSTRQIKYATDIMLVPAVFNDPEGYYVVWERCCRNRVVTNIADPGSAGNSFYMEFPAVATPDGKSFFNSSPNFVVPKGDYACINTPFVFDFGATDPDGDELRYSLVAPISGHSSRNYPNPSALTPPVYRPAPYPSVIWAPGIDLNNVIPGSSPLRVNARTGQLTFTANKLGLYVFSVRCEELRAGRKIGEVRRDFQLMVIDCPVNQGPAVRMKVPNQPGYYLESQLINITDPNQRCLDLLITDANRQENVKLTVRPLNFGASLASVAPSGGVIQGPGDTLRAKVCLSNCVESPGPYWIEVIATDAGCPAPKSDTLRVQFNVPMMANATPDIVTSLVGNAGFVRDGEMLNFAVTGTDPDGDPISVEAAGRGFNLADLGMSFAGGTGTGTLTAPFSWKPNCDRVQPGVAYVVDFTVTDNRCAGSTKKDVVTVSLEYQQRDNERPDVSTDLAGNSTVVRPGQSVRFNVLGTDTDNDPITVRAVGRGFDMAAAGMQFESGKAGIGRLSTPFAWSPDCTTLEAFGSYFVIDFVLQDNRCAANRADTVTVTIDLSDYEVVPGVFEPYNVFTPDGDDINPAFMLPNLPPDNCKDQFQRIEVYNRWGKLVFQSGRRDFAWTGDGYPVGIYYYLIKYRNSVYKGTVSLLR